MTDTYGILKQISPTKYSWNWDGEGKPLPEIVKSESFCVYGGKYYFQIIVPTRGIWNLGLYNINGATFDMNMLLECRNSTTNVSLKPSPRPLPYFIATMTPDIREITCTFSKIQQSIESGSEQSKTENVCGTAKHVGELKEEKENIETEELQKMKGLSVLSNELRNAFLNEDDSDVILKVGDQNYPAHKVIIRNRSSVFRAMLEHDMKEKTQGTVDIKDCDPKAFRDFLLYLYTGKLDAISKENVFELYYLSDKYDVIQLKLDCVDYIKNNLSIDIICSVISLATKYSESHLLQHAIKFFIENANDIFVTVKWQEFMKENPTQANELIIKAFNNISKK